ncbi:hypothetical protein BpHYR1_015420 [Brachionus plicatilis]|uniref:Uncharacterized protein n=1 Tax=Brachionus plicatilis TaxID=10195 RepID=A0A3M7P3Z4_BRAPC|nr:hypothetical protein BpHYR1_015420 [Brachionus plicatilis]
MIKFQEDHSLFKSFFQMFYVEIINFCLQPDSFAVWLKQIETGIFKKVRDLIFYKGISTKTRIEKKIEVKKPQKKKE